MLFAWASSRVVALCVALSLSAPAPEGSVAPPQAAASEPAPTLGDGPLAVFLLDYREGERLFQASDYGGAIERWTRAYASLPDLPDYAAYRGRVLFELAEAHLRAYEGDRDLAHVRRAEQLYTEYRRFIALEDEATAALLTNKRAAVLEILEAARREEEARREAELAATRRAEAEREQLRQLALRDALATRELQRTAKQRRSLFAAGGAVAAAGLPLLGAMSYGLYAGARVEQEGASVAAMWTAATDSVEKDALLGRLQELRVEGQGANQLALGVGLAGGALLAIGVTLIVVGARSRGKKGAGLGRRLDGLRVSF